MRFIIAIDVDGNNLVEGYKELTNIMNGKVDPSKIEWGWESTDEVFDNDGELVSPDELQASITQAFEEMEATY